MDLVAGGHMGLPHVYPNRTLRKGEGTRARKAVAVVAARSTRNRQSDDVLCAVLALINFVASRDKRLSFMDSF